MYSEHGTSDDNEAQDLQGQERYWGLYRHGSQLHVADGQYGSCGKQ